MTGPKEDRYQLLKATGVNLSPGLLRDAARDGHDLAGPAHGGGANTRNATTDDGVHHRMWTCPAAVDDAGAATGDVGALLAELGSGPLTIADGHHRYESDTSLSGGARPEPRLRERPRVGLRDDAAVRRVRGTAGAADAPGAGDRPLRGGTAGCPCGPRGRGAGRRRGRCPGCDDPARAAALAGCHGHRSDGARER